MVVITDEEWDIRKLKDPKGKVTTGNAVIKRVHDSGYQTYAIVVRPNQDQDLNEDTIVSVTKDYHSSSILLLSKT